MGEDDPKHPERMNTKEKAAYNKRKIGGQFEKIAANYLISCGVLVLEQNYRCKRGEIDLIVLDGKFLVFVEVKYRKNDRNGMPAEAVNYPKQKRIRDTAEYYLYSHGYSANTPCRFDVVGILGKQIQWIKNAF